MVLETLFALFFIASLFFIIPFILMMEFFLFFILGMGLFAGIALFFGGELAVEIILLIGFSIIGYRIARWFFKS